MLGTTLNLIRSVFNRDRSIPQPAATPQILNPYGYAASGNSAVGPQSDFNSYLNQSTQINQDLLSRYADYVDMASYPELGNALTILADEATQHDTTTGKSIWFESKDEIIKNILDYTFNTQLNYGEILSSLTRTMCQMGNCFREIVVLDGYGVVKLVSSKVGNVRRVEDKAGNLFGYMFDETMNFRMNTEEFMHKLMLNGDFNVDQDKMGDGIKVYEPWEMVHWRLRNDDSDLYGYSIYESARWVWKRLQMIEDAMVLFKLTRAPQRYVFYVDVGDVPPNEARKIVNQVKQDFKKQKFIDPSSNKVSWRYSPLAVDEDLFIAKRKEKRSTEIDILSGLDGQSVDDANYFKDKLLGSLPMPKSYLGADETIGRANLGWQHIRFASTVLRVQREVKNGTRQIADVDLAARNIDPDQVDYSVHMVIPSGALELSHIEVQKAKCELASLYQGLNFPEFYIYTKILGLSEDEAVAVETLRAIQTPQQPSPETTPSPEQQATPEEIKSSIERKFVKQKTNYKHKEVENQIIDNIQRSNGEFSRHVRELRGLMSEIKHAVNGARRK